MTSKKVTIAEDSKSGGKNNWNSTIFLLSIKDSNFDSKEFFLVSGYKSPSTPSAIFQGQIGSIMNVAQKSFTKDTIFIGDFNFDPTTSRCTISSILKEYQMISKLNSKEITTNENTQIDVVFTNFDRVICGTYESYFSDHKPVFCTLNAIKPLKINLGKIVKPQLKSIQHHAERINIQAVPILPTIKPLNLNVLTEDYSDKKSLLDEIIDIPDVNDDELYSLQQAAAQTEMDRLNTIVRDITRPGSMLKDLSIDWFVDNLINANREIPFNMKPTVYKQRIERYTEADRTRDDLQFIFSGHWSTVGHYILVHFVAAENVVKIYDSLHGRGTHGRSLELDENAVISRLYPGVRTEFVRPATTQTDGVSCGVFAIAYATTIILGENPANYQLQMNIDHTDQTIVLREHIEKIYLNRSLELFPQSNRFRGFKNPNVACYANSTVQCLFNIRPIVDSILIGPDCELKQIWIDYNNSNTAGLLSVNVLRRKYYHANLNQQQDASEFLLYLLKDEVLSFIDNVFCFEQTIFNHCPGCSFESRGVAQSREITFTLHISNEMLPGSTMTDLINDNFQSQQQWEPIENSKCDVCQSHLMTGTVSQNFNEVIIFVLQIARGDGSKIDNFNLREIVSNQVEIENKRY